MISDNAPADDALRKLMAGVPKDYTARFAELVGLTDAFCDAHLDAEYRDFCRQIAATLCQEGLPVLKGKGVGWACGIVYALGQVNFLTDPGQTPHVTATAIAEGFGVSATTMHARAKVIREALELMPFHPSWCLPSNLAENPLVWMLEVDGLLVDIRGAPREVQVAAYEQGLIPYIPATSA